MKKLRVTVDGKTYEVLVEMMDEGAPAVESAPRTSANPVVAASVSAPVAAGAPAPASRGPAGSGDVPSPLAGKVVSIDVKIGQSVDEGTQVATLEAMKMNTYIYAPRAGVVAAVLVNAGDAVEEGATLVKLA